MAKLLNTTVTGTLNVSSSLNAASYVTTGGLDVLGVANSRTINYVINGGGATITSGATEAAQSKGYVISPFGCTVQSWTVLANTSGSIKIDIWTSTYASFPTMVMISGTNAPRLDTAQKNTSSSIAGWSSGVIAAGNVIQFRVNSSPSISVDQVTVMLNVA